MSNQLHSISQAGEWNSLSLTEWDRLLRYDWPIIRPDVQRMLLKLNVIHCSFKIYTSVKYNNFRDGEFHTVLYMYVVK